MSVRKDLNFEDFEKILKTEKEKVEKNIDAIKAEIDALAL